jgi:hypothetical protein
MSRKTSYKKYLLAFVLTIIVFAGGIIMGLFIENLRLADTKQNSLLEKANLQSLQLQQRYIDSGIADCDALNRVLETNIAELTRKMAIVVDYDKNAILNQKEFRLQLRDYFLTEIQYFLITQEIDQKCSKENIKIIYFYDESSIDTQGEILDYLKKLFGHKVLVFSLNSAFKEEPMIDIMLTSYNISQFPSVVVGDKVFHGHSSVKELHSAICNEFTSIKGQFPKECIKK